MFLVIAFCARSQEARLVYPKDGQAFGLEEVNLDFSDLISIDGIAALLEQNEWESNILADAETAYEQEVLARELALEEAENKQVIDFMQLRYRGPHEDL